MVAARTGDDVRVYAIWEPMLPTDWWAPTTAVLRRLSDARVRQYWDPDHVFAKRLEADARPPQPTQQCCVRSGVLWDLAAVYRAGVTWTDRLPTATMFNGPVVDAIGEIEKAVAAGAPAKIEGSATPEFSR